MTLFWTVDVGLTLESLQTLAQLAAMVFIAWDLTQTLPALNAGLQAYVLGAWVTAGSTIAVYLAGASDGSGRFAPAGFNENNAGVIIALGIPVAWYQTFRQHAGTRGNSLKLLNRAYVPIGTLAILLTASRAALIATLPAFLYVIWSLKRLRLVHRALVFACLVSAMLVLQPLVPQTSVERFSTIRTSTGLEPLGRRLEIWRGGIEVFLENPLLGVGSGAFRAVTESGRAPHNFVLSLNTELGIVGFGVFAVILFMAGYYARRQPGLRSGLWLAILSMWITAAATHNFEQKKPLWLFLCFVFVGSALPAMPVEKAAQSMERYPAAEPRAKENGLRGPFGRRQRTARHTRFSGRQGVSKRAET
jgi:O-antigen ligase